MLRNTSFSLLLLSACLLSVSAAWGQAARPKPRPKQRPNPRATPAAKAITVQGLSSLALRNIGPASMGGRVIDIAVQESRPSTFYVATASGGLWKTMNNGTSFQPLFQHERTVSIGDIAVSQSHPNMIWVGTGEANNRNSTSYGNGVYLSEDGGKTFKHMGLPKSYHIGRIAIHPRNPNVVFVAACGDLWAPNPERGLYRTRDRGKSWDLVLAADDKTGATEVRIDPENPNVVYAALYERQRDGFDTNDPKKRWGPGSGLYRSDDGGDTWKKLTKGLPTVLMGRISLDIYRKNPRVVYALIETEQIGTLPKGATKPKPKKGGPAFMGINAVDGENGAVLSTVTAGGPSAKAGLKEGDLVQAFDKDKIDSYDSLIAGIRKHKAGDKVKVQILRAGKKQQLELTFGSRSAIAGGGGGRGGRSPVADRIHGQIANRMKMQGPNGFQTGGVYRTDDRGETWRRVNSLNPRPYYFSQIRVDPSDDNHIWVCGISFHGSKDKGKTFANGNVAPTVHVDHHALWVDPKDGRHMLLGCDGGVNVTWDRSKSWETFENLPIGQCYHAVADTRRPYWVYAGYQDNGSWGSPSATRYSDGIMNTDAFKIGGGDGFVCRVDRNNPDIVFSESQGGAMSWRNIMTGARGGVNRSGNVFSSMIPRGQGNRRRGRYNWNTPFFLSAFNTETIYFAGSQVYKSPDRGRHSIAISEEITLTDRGSATALCESPRQPGLLYVGTDDGAVWVTRDDGKKWTPLHETLQKLLPKDSPPLWVSHIYASRFQSGRAYLCFDGHRHGDKNAYIFVTENYGKTWKSISKGILPDSAHCCYEDTVNQDLLFAGTETGLFISLDRGKSWNRQPAPFPTVAVRDLDFQEREQHLIIATHGRSVWILDIRALRKMTRANLAKPVLLVKPNDVLRLRMRSRSRQGTRHWRASNPAQRAEIYYHVSKNTKEKIEIEVRDVLGKLLWSTKGKGTPGLHRVDWNLRMRRGAGSGSLIARMRRSMGRRGGSVAPAGDYAVTLRMGKTTQTESFKIEADNALLDTAWPRSARVGEGIPAEEEEALDAIFEARRKAAKQGDH